MTAQALLGAEAISSDLGSSVLAWSAQRTGLRARPPTLICMADCGVHLVARSGDSVLSLNVVGAERYVSPVTSTLRCSVYELRQYTLRPGVRDAFVTLFDTELVDSQEAAGMLILGQFTDLDRPDMFVWIRGFRDMSSRRTALETFYGGPVWAAHREAANAMMLDSDDVLLLKTARGAAPLETHVQPRVPKGGATLPISVITVRILPIPVGDADAAFDHKRQQSSTAREVRAALSALVTERASNSFPQLPVRDDAHVLVTIARADGMTELDANPAEQLRLVPTSRSALR